MIALLPCRPDWGAIVAGRATGPHLAFESELKERVAKAGLADRILFVGEHTNIPDWYRALDLFVAPQRWEGFGLTPLEAMATGVPVVATDVGAFSELVTGGSEETGLIIAADDLKGWSMRQPPSWMTGRGLPPQAPMVWHGPQKLRHRAGSPRDRSGLRKPDALILATASRQTAADRRQ